MSSQTITTDQGKVYRLEEVEVLMKNNSLMRPYAYKKVMVLIPEETE